MKINFDWDWYTFAIGFSFQISEGILWVELGFFGMVVFFNGYPKRWESKQ